MNASEMPPEGGDAGEAGHHARAGMKQRRVAVILLTHDQRELTLRSVGSVRKAVAEEDLIVVWDNGSTDGTIEALEREHGGAVEVLRSEANVGVATGRNEAVRAIEREYRTEFLLFLDNDMTADPPAIDALVSALRRDPRAASATGKIRILGEPGRIFGAGGIIIDFRTGRTGHVGYGAAEGAEGSPAGDSLPSGGCFFVRTKIFLEAGGFDPVFDPYGPEDIDLGLRLRKRGYGSLYVSSAVFHHPARASHTAVGGLESSAYVRRKAAHWRILLARHATPAERAYFYLVGAPLGLARSLSRELARGNLRGVLGFVRALADSFRRR